MPKYLFICSDYLSSSDANGICVKNVVNELKKGGKVSVISESDNDGILYESEQEVIYGVRRTSFSSFIKKHGESGLFAAAVRIIRGSIAAINYPNVSQGRSEKVYQLANRLVTNGDADIVVCVYRPFESLYAGMRLKKAHTDIRVIGYHLDLLTEPNNTNPCIVAYKKLKANRFIQREIETFDRIILPKSMKRYTDHSKLCYADFPLFSLGNEQQASGFAFEKEYVNFAYIGSIDGCNREITYLLRILDGAQKKIGRPIRLNVWGNADQSVQQQIGESDIAQYHGLIDNTFTDDLLNNADFVVNLSNRNTYAMVPSKIFQLFSCRKPVLNIVESEQDAALPYFLQNSFACNVYAYLGELVSDVEKVSDFIMEYSGRCQNADVIENLYRESKPAYVVDLIEDTVNRKE